MGSDKKSGCIVCGSELVYSTKTFEMACSKCEKIVLTNCKCADNHYICDQCHRESADDFIMDWCLKSDSIKPIEMTRELLQDLDGSMHGPEHHFLVPAIMITAYLNYVGNKKKKKSMILTARKRAEKILGGFCGYFGACGAAIGTGIFISTITNCSPLKKKAFALSNNQTAASLKSIADVGGPRCCKRNTYLAMISAKLFLFKHFNINLPDEDVGRCDYIKLNEECLLDECPFFKF